MKMDKWQRRRGVLPLIFPSTLAAVGFVAVMGVALASQGSL
jgi:hypothetical protein